MKVFVLTVCSAYEYECVVGVFSSKDKALAQVKAHEEHSTPGQWPFKKGQNWHNLYETSIDEILPPFSGVEIE